jgi:hypothetical protein
LKVDKEREKLKIIDFFNVDEVLEQQLESLVGYEQKMQKIIADDER